MKYSKYLDQCLKDLEDAREYKTDELAVELVRIQRLTEKIFHFHSTDLQVDEQPETPTMARLKTFRVELDSLRDALPKSLKCDCKIPQSRKNVASWYFADPGIQTFSLATTTLLISGYLSLFWQVHIYRTPRFNPSLRCRFQACRYLMSSRISPPR